MAAQNPPPPRNGLDCRTDEYGAVAPAVVEYVRTHAHLAPCACAHHDAVCADCGLHIIVARDSYRECGHERRETRGDGDCPHRPDSVRATDLRSEQGVGG